MYKRQMHECEKKIQPTLRGRRKKCADNATQEIGF